METEETDSTETPEIHYRDYQMEYGNLKVTHLL